MSGERRAGSESAFKHLWWMTPVPVARAVISLTPDKSEVLKENGKLIYLNFHPEQIVHLRNPTRQCTERLENCQRLLPTTLTWKDTILIHSYAIVSPRCTTINVIWKTVTKAGVLIWETFQWDLLEKRVLLDLANCIRFEHMFWAYVEETAGDYWKKSLVYWSTYCRCWIQ